ncbi:glycosyltransferase family 39 protein [Fulvivirga sp. 29W222]|uniref:Glycosyltransferase family 39 protein n=1 Tax=Fulvivirga marina TaxID=2494733 RepID=A0A937FX99_9BACT|nr:glycosyltransferase family 39 protein [Fulvivirga marina]MBL6447749.1 glycosyltransferase family 39 protein [Fulvivirga marina]
MKPIYKLSGVRVSDLALSILMIFAAIILFSNLATWGVTETSEARYAEISREMYLSGDYMHPRLLKIGHYHKPPLTYWITAFAYSIFGVTAFAARFFLQVALLIQIYLVYRLGQLLFKNSEAAFHSACIYFAFPLVIISSRALTTDAYLTTTVLASIFAWIKYKKGRGIINLYFFYTCMGLGMLIKGPVAFIAPVTVAVASHWLIKKDGRNMIKHHLAGVLILLTVGSSWYIMLWKENHDFFNYFVVDHIFNRFMTNNFGRRQPFWFFIVVAIITTFPWFVMIVNVLFAKKKTAILKLLLIWVFVPLCFFSLSSSKLILYILPIYAGMALAAAYMWHNMILMHKQWLTAYSVFTVLILLGLMLAPLLDKSLLFNTEVYFLVCGVGLVILIAVLLKWHRHKLSLIYYQVLVTSTLTLFSSLLFSSNPEKLHDQKNLAAFISSIPGVDQVYVYNELLPSLAFELNKDIISVNAGSSHLFRETRFEEECSWEDYFIGEEKLNKVNTKESAFVMDEKDGISEEVQGLLCKYSKKRHIEGWVVFYNGRSIYL